MTPNPGRCPSEARGKRVYVTLANGTDNRRQISDMAPPGWPADGRFGCNWDKQPGWPFNIETYEVIK